VLKLGISVRSLRRLIQRYRETGIKGLSWRRRGDRGQRRISLDWQEFILKTYREGNQNGCRMTRAQVAVRVKVRAQQLGTDNYPGRTSVYRLLQAEIENHQIKQRVRSIGWRGDCLRQCPQRAIV